MYTTLTKTTMFPLFLLSSVIGSASAQEYLDFFWLQNENGGCLELPGEGQQTRVTPCDTTNIHQRWYRRDSENYRIFTALSLSRVCLDVEGHSLNNGARVLGYAAQDIDMIFNRAVAKMNQEWTYHPSGWTELRPRHDPSACLDKNENDPEKKVITWTCHGGKNQKWQRLYPKRMQTTNTNGKIQYDFSELYANGFSCGDESQKGAQCSSKVFCTLKQLPNEECMFL